MIYKSIQNNARKNNNIYIIKIIYDFMSWFGKKKEVEENSSREIKQHVEAPPQKNTSRTALPEMPKLPKLPKLSPSSNAKPDIPAPGKPSIM